MENEKPLSARQKEKHPKQKGGIYEKAPNQETVCLFQWTLEVNGGRKARDKPEDEGPCNDK